MNKFEEKFFQKYTPEGQEIRGIIHQHFIRILGRLFLWIGGGVLLPSFLFYYSGLIKEVVPFFLLEVYLYIIFIKIIYDIFDWYNDVWIITDDGVVDLDWSLFSTDMVTLRYENIEGIEVDQNGVIDTLLNKGDLIIHKIGDGDFTLKDAIIPYDGVDLIEEISSEYRDHSSGDDKFEQVMEVLGGVMEDYLERTAQKKETQKHDTYERIYEVENNEGTIDLR